VGGCRLTVPNPAGLDFGYAATVAKDGTVYFVGSGNGCGVHAALYSWKSGPAPTKLLDVSPFDIERVVLGTFQGRPTLYVSHHDCGTPFSDRLAELPLQGLP
jgi:hypothetical protein